MAEAAEWTAARGTGSGELESGPKRPKDDFAASYVVGGNHDDPDALVQAPEEVPRRHQGPPSAGPGRRRDLAGRARIGERPEEVAALLSRLQRVEWVYQQVNRERRSGARLRPEYQRPF